MQFPNPRRTKPMRLAFSIILSAIFCLPAFAQSTTGPYFGAMVSQRNSQDRENPFGNATEKPLLFGSVLAGHQWRSGGFAFALEGEIGTSHSNGANLAGRARAGWGLGNMQMYGFAGLTRTTDHSAKMGYFGGGFDGGKTVAATMIAPVWGAGVEIAVSPEFALRSEVQFASYRPHTFSFAAFDGYSEARITKHFSDAELRFGAIYRPSLGDQKPTQNGPSRSNWSGAYAGADFGYVLRRSVIDPFYFPFSSLNVYADQNRLASFGGFAGHLWSFGNIYVGPELRLAGLERGHYSGTLQLRAGVPLGNALIYGVAGWQRTTGSLHEDRKKETISASHSGLTFGVGVEAMINERLSMRLQANTFNGRKTVYNFTGELRYSHGDPYWIGSPPRGAKLEDQSVQIGIAYHFN